MNQAPEEPEDILSSSLDTFYGHRPVTLSTSPGSVFTYTSPSIRGPDNKSFSIDIQLSTPDTLAANWALHASSIWAASKFMADIIIFGGKINFSLYRPTKQRVRVLELGAGAGLPGIALSRLMLEEVDVTVSDYPDPLLISTLVENVSRNSSPGSHCTATGYAWGDDPSHTFAPSHSPHPPLGYSGGSFDIILGSDTLWNSSLHSQFLSALHLNLKKTSTARIHLVAGLHTGRFTLDKFFQLALESGLDIEQIVEMESNVTGREAEERPWITDRADFVEGEDDRRKWVVWVVLKWNACNITEYKA